MDRKNFLGAMAGGIFGVIAPVKGDKMADPFAKENKTNARTRMRIQIIAKDTASGGKIKWGGHTWSLPEDSGKTFLVDKVEQDSEVLSWNDGLKFGHYNTDIDFIMYQNNLPTTIYPEPEPKRDIVHFDSKKNSYLDSKKNVLYMWWDETKWP
jgi:hypothetical protein